MDENPTPHQGEIVPPEGRTQEIVESRLELSMRGGPLPSPEELRQFNEIIPHGAERIMRMAEKEQDGHLWGNKMQEWRAMAGVASGFCVAVAAFAVSAYGFSVGATVEAAAVAGTTLVALVGVFIRGTSTQQAQESPEREGRAELPDGQ